MTGAVDIWADPDLTELVRMDAPLVAIADALVEGARTGAGARRRRRVPIALAAALVILVIGLAPAVASSRGLRTLLGFGPVPIPRGPQVHATLTSRVPANERAGMPIRVSWKLWSRGDNGKIAPFDSGAIFARIVNPALTAASTAPATGRRGRYSALLRIPPGGIGHIQIGMVAERFGPSGTRPIRVFFPIGAP